MIPTAYFDLMSRIEKLGERAFMLNRVAQWPGLTLEQRAIHYTIALVIGPDALTVDKVADLLQIDVALVQAALTRQAPFIEVVSDDVRQISPGAQLSYGGKQ